MLPQQKSLRANFLIKLIAAMVVLELFFSAIFYSYIRYSVDTELKESIVKQARYLFATYDDIAKTLDEKKAILRKTMKVQARIVALPNENFRAIHFKSYRKNKRYYQLVLSFCT